MPKTTVVAKTTTVQPKTTVAAKTTTVQPKTTVLSTVSTIATTQPNPVCADCYPDVSDILILMDCSNAQEADAFENQKNAVIQLTSNWNHMKRVSAACYSSALDQFAPYSSLNSNNDLALLINAQNLQQSAPDLSKYNI
ncbi:unnamed protein product [Auanema sp. JU1783]|nr:unnamed protein product [Auanema sp. JU1783]